MSDNNTIMDTDNIAEILDLGPDEDISNMSATTTPTGAPMEFHVQMRGHTFGDMQELIVQAAAQQIIRGVGDASMRKLVEARCIELITAKADEALKNITAEIIDQPVTPKYSYGKAEATPVTMREFIGLTGRQYLAERVDYSGKVNERSSYNEKSRIQYLVESRMDTVFKREIESATNSAIREVQDAIKARHNALLEAEKARLRAALATATGDAK